MLPLMVIPITHKTSSITFAVVEEDSLIWDHALAASKMLGILSSWTLLSRLSSAQMMKLAMLFMAGVHIRALLGLALNSKKVATRLVNAKWKLEDQASQIESLRIFEKSLVDELKQKKAELSALVSIANINKAEKEKTEKERDKATWVSIELK
ncbi:unnamed protein product [Ilex paraguariensis]|uniref:Uncharacterized protein n=1 Tax=Ilex paraguariensis TaxID=185542 RepID=A0ABC8SZ18_9AQUA